MARNSPAKKESPYVIHECYVCGNPVRSDKDIYLGGGWWRHDRCRPMSARYMERFPDNFSTKLMKEVQANV